MSASVRNEEVRATEEEVVAVRVSSVDSEVPETTVPVERAIEVGGVQECAILPVEEDIAQVHVALTPIHPVEVIDRVDAHQIVEVGLVCSLVLVFGEVELISHLVGEEEGLLSSLLITHC